MLALETGTPLADCDPAWLCLYFSVVTAALLMMDDNGNVGRCLCITFAAAIFLLGESPRGSPSLGVDFNDEVRLAIRYLDEVKSRNAIADRASDILRHHIKHMDVPMP
ncbi:hypothetical protein LX36DRAFT_172440 [Colletotrichum falcatum]|nr:hypothetical protein LX36DRAFT_172440 [Colletotrichum falcatum]